MQGAAARIRQIPNQVPNSVTLCRNLGSFHGAPGSVKNNELCPESCRYVPSRNFEAFAIEQEEGCSRSEAQQLAVD